MWLWPGQHQRCHDHRCRFGRRSCCDQSTDIKLRDLTKGFQAGFDYQFANGLVVGVEAERTWMKHQEIKKSLATEGAALAAAGWLQASTQYELDWMWTVRGRAGFAFDRLFVFRDGGSGLAQGNESEKSIPVECCERRPAGRQPAPSLKHTEPAMVKRRGWTFGGGAEYALTNNWSIKGEYSHAHFGEEDVLFSGARGGVSVPIYIRPWSDTDPNPRPPRPAPFPPWPDIPVYQTTNVPGHYNTVAGRKAANALDLHAIKIGLNYRF